MDSWSSYDFHSWYFPGLPTRERKVSIHGQDRPVLAVVAPLCPTTTFHARQTLSFIKENSKWQKFNGGIIYRLIYDQFDESLTFPWTLDQGRNWGKILGEAKLKFSFSSIETQIET